MSDERLNQAVMCELRRSSVIEFAHSKSNDWVRHTAIVVKFDGKPVFTLDYGANETNTTLAKRFLYNLARALQFSATALNFLASGSAITVSPFDFGTTAIVGTILKFALNTEAGRERAVDLLMKLADITMGDYSLTGNNCRDFVSRASEILTSDKETRAQVQQQQINKTKREKVELGLAAGVTAVAAYELGKALYDWMTSPSESEQRTSRRQRE